MTIQPEKIIWEIAELLRGDYSPREYVDVTLPLIVIRRLDQAMEPHRANVWREYDRYRGRLTNLHGVLKVAASDSPVYNTSQYTWERLLTAPDDLLHNMITYLNGYSPDVQDVIEKFDFRRQVQRLHSAGLLQKAVRYFDSVDLHPDRVSNHQMGDFFEELIRRFRDQYNESAGEHFTPREVIKLMVELLFAESIDLKTRKVLTVFDPACGTGGMLTEAEAYIREHNRDATILLHGQEINPFAYAVAKSDMLLKGYDPERIAFGNSFTEDGHNYRDDKKQRFNFMLSNPPFGVDWKKVEWVIKLEHEIQGYDGRFGAGLPRINDGSLLFLQHILSKMSVDEESRIAIVFNGSPLFTGDAGSGESEIRRWIMRQDWLEGIVALPDQLFYNTGINTYIWILTNRKSKQRKGKVQLINGVDLYTKMRKSKGDKRKEIGDADRTYIVEQYRTFQESGLCRIFDNEDFGYHKLTIERPLRLNFEASSERIKRLKATKAFMDLANSRKKDSVEQEAEISKGRELQSTIITRLQELDFGLIRSARSFHRLIDQMVKELHLKDPVKKAIIDALSNRDPEAEIVVDKHGNPEPDPELRDYEIVPLKQDFRAFFHHEVKPHLPDAWFDPEKIRVGYEINTNRYFYKYTPLRPLPKIEADIKAIEQDVLSLLAEVV